jgi:formate hydrogenlyase transcriptional activator
MEKARILIVEDESIIAMEIESQLQNLGFEVTSIVDTGEKAIKKAESDKPDLILMDIRIKGKMDGIETAQEIWSKNSIPVIFCTAFLDDNKIERAKKILPFGYLVKPIQEKDLNVSIKIALYSAKVEKQRKQAEKILQENETKYRELFDGMSSGVAVYEAINNGEDFIFVDLNKAGEKIDQVKKMDIMGKSVCEIFPGVIRFGLFDIFKKVWASGKSEKHPVSLYQDNRINQWRENYIYRLPSGQIVAIYDDITQCKQAEETLEKKTHELSKRVKELNCFYGISALFQKPDLSLANIFKEVLNLISSSWQYPNDTCACFRTNGNKFQSSEFKATEWKQSAKVNVHEEEYGSLEVFYKKEKEIANEGPFLKEERLLLDSVAERLGKTIERYQAEKKVTQMNRELEKLSSRLKDENEYLQDEIKSTHHFDNIVGKSKPFLKVLTSVEQVAKSHTTVLILGETGTGKEMIARIIHDLSPKSELPLVKVNCATLPKNLIESELFGYQKGAFTGAMSDKKGRFELADQGTIFLDEIGELSINLQAKLLRVLQEGEFERLGGVDTIKVNVRVITATNKNLKKLCEDGQFRDDLFYRLNVFPVECPPLRNRKGDITLLVKYFIQYFNKKLDKTIEQVSKDTIEILNTYDWPGNIRELQNVVERSMILSKGNQLEIGVWFSQQIKDNKQSSILTMDDMQRAHINHVLESTDGIIGGKSGAAHLLGMNRSTLHFRMKKLGLKISRKSVNI